MAGATATSSTRAPGGAPGAAGASPADRLKLARRLYAQTGSRTDTQSALEGLGYSKSDARALVDEVAGPAPQPQKKNTKETPGVVQDSGSAPATSSTPPATSKRTPAGPSTTSQQAADLLPSYTGPAPTLRPPRRLSAADGGGFLLGVFLFALGNSYLRYGTTGITSWFGAKFVNKPAASVVAAEAQRGITAKTHQPVSQGSSGSSSGSSSIPAPGYSSPGGADDYGRAIR